VLDVQRSDFASRERFTLAVLGLLSLTGRVQALAGLSPQPSPRQAGRGREDLAALLLGVVSVGRTLRATLDLAAPARTEPPPTPPPPAQRILR
jgi:hypothetical protein